MQLGPPCEPPHSVWHSPRTRACPQTPTKDRERAKLTRLPLSTHSTATHLHPVSILVLVNGQLERLGRKQELVTGRRRREQRLRPPRASAIHLIRRPRGVPELPRTLPMVVMQVEGSRPQLGILLRVMGAVVVIVVVGICQSMSKSYTN